MHKRTVVEPARVRSYQRQQLRCGKCDRLIDHEMEVDIPMMEFAQAMMALRCPHCGSKKLLMGQNRTLAEDQAYPSSGTVEERAEIWLANGEIGSSSEAIRRHMVGKVRPIDQMPAPRDVSDLRRCILLLHRIPEWRPRMGEMSVHPQWQHLAPAWEAIEAMFVEEAGPGLEHAKLPRTAEALQRAVQ